MLAVVADVLPAEQAASGRPRSRHWATRVIVAAVEVDPPEEVVRREEHQVAAAVAEAVDGVVLVLGHVLVVAGEDDQLVRLREPRAGRAVELGLREEVDLLAGLRAASAGSGRS